MRLYNSEHSQESFFFNLMKFENNIALILENGEQVSYLKLSELVEEFAQYIEQKLPSQTIKRLFFIQCDNGLHSLVSYLYSLKYQHCALLLSSDMSEQWLAELYQAYSPNFLVRDSANGTYDTRFDVDVISKQTLAVNKDLAILLSTSGSTGSPKQVRLSFHNLNINALQIAEYLALKENERAIASLPMHYSYGLSVINSHLTVGASIIMNKHSILTKEFWSAFKQHEATSFAGVPYQYEVLKKLRFERMKLPSLRYMTQAGGRLSECLRREFSDLLKSQGKAFFVMYGQTEATARMAYLSPDDMDRLDSIGKPIPGGHFEIISENGKLLLEAGQQGELAYIGDNVMMGYATSAVDLAKPVETKKLLTGDIAYQDEQGYFYLVGRKNRIAKLFGTRIDLDDLDKRIFELGVKSISVQLDQNQDQKIYVCLDGTESETRLSKQKEQVKECLVNLLNFKQVYFQLIVLSSIPRTHNGKVAFAEINKLINDQLYGKNCDR